MSQDDAGGRRQAQGPVLAQTLGGEKRLEGFSMVGASMPEPCREPGCRHSRESVTIRPSHALGLAIRVGSMPFLSAKASCRIFVFPTRLAFVLLGPRPRP